MLQEWYQNVVGSGMPFQVQYGLIFVAIFAALGLCLLIIRRFLGRGGETELSPRSLARQPRLGIVDIYELDRQRQLILLRRDNVEHLILVGGPNDVVIERQIQRTMPPRTGTVDELPVALQAPPVQPERLVAAPAETAMQPVVPGREVAVRPRLSTMPTAPVEVRLPVKQPPRPSPGTMADMAQDLEV